jgi:hypothetical protein
MLARALGMLSTQRGCDAPSAAVATTQCWIVLLSTTHWLRLLLQLRLPWPPQQAELRGAIGTGIPEYEANVNRSDVKANENANENKTLEEKKPTRRLKCDEQWTSRVH